MPANLEPHPAHNEPEPPLPAPGISLETLTTTRPSSHLQLTSLIANRRSHSFITWKKSTSRKAKVLIESKSAAIMDNFKNLNLGQTFR